MDIFKGDKQGEVLSALLFCNTLEFNNIEFKLLFLKTNLTHEWALYRWVRNALFLYCSFQWKLGRTFTWGRFPRILEKIETSLFPFGNLPCLVMTTNFSIWKCDQYKRSYGRSKTICLKFQPSHVRTNGWLHTTAYVTWIIINNNVVSSKN